jgi:hypothetical protein
MFRPVYFQGRSAKYPRTGSLKGRRTSLDVFGEETCRSALTGIESKFLGRRTCRLVIIPMAEGEEEVVVWRKNLQVTAPLTCRLPSMWREFPTGVLLTAELHVNFVCAQIHILTL